MTTSSSHLTKLNNKPPSLKHALVYFGSFVILGLSLAILGPTLPGLADQTGSNLSQISTIFLGNSFGVILGTLLGGRLLDRRNGHPIIALSYIVFAILYIVLTFVFSLWLLVTVFFFLGICAGIIDVSCNALIVRLFGREVSPYMNTLHLTFGLGALLGPMFVDRVIVYTGGIRLVFWLLALCMLPMAIWLTRVPSPQQQLVKEDVEEKSPISRQTFLILISSALFFIMVGTEIGYSSWIFSYAVALKLGPDTIARVLNSTFWGGFTLGRLVSIPMAVRWRPSKMLLVDIIGTLLSLGLLLVFPLWTPAVWITTFCLGFSIASMFPTTLNFLSRRLSMSGQMTSYLLVGGAVGGMVLPWLVGQFFESTGPQSLLVICEISMLVGLALFWVINRQTGKSPIKNTDI